MIDTLAYASLTHGGDCVMTLGLIRWEWPVNDEALRVENIFFPGRKNVEPLEERRHSGNELPSGTGLLSECRGLS